ncbi:MAG: tRNA (N(6)-L-threonylcarbamoyladenosine(37)-C(2))-methylthiotransferase MtaB [Anaerolineaceae bacterium]|nr:tRNA (N(6)-L-threonylcarbamoyladenosine(37)-C(2))-methylthiotransferase MtaB [Anaerolineaceae bacterium]
MNIYLDTIGCRLNQSEIEKMGQQFRQAGHRIIDDPSEADIVVVNTCTVTSKAASDSRGKIRKANRAGCQEIIVTGCWSDIDPQGALALPGVQNVVMNKEKDFLVRDLLSLTPQVFDAMNADQTLIRHPLPGKLQRTRAFIKVQDGCDNFCTYCLTRVARGKSRSVPLPEIMRDIHTAEQGDVKEVVLTGVHLASWGQDFSPPTNINHLAAEILNQSRIPRLRLSSLEPWDLNEEFFQLFENPRLCQHLHLPLQSGTEKTLRRMARKITPDEYHRLLRWARNAAPKIALTTDIIVGFPGESEEDFEDSLSFVQEMNFTGGHVFSFSPREGTPAMNYDQQLPNDVKKERNAKMRAVLAATEHTYHQQFLDQTVSVLWESAKKEGNHWLLSGLTQNYLRVNTSSNENRWNQFDEVHLKKLDQGSFFGEITP